MVTEAMPTSGFLFSKSLKSDFAEVNPWPITHLQRFWCFISLGWNSRSPNLVNHCQNQLYKMPKCNEPGIL